MQFIVKKWEIELRGDVSVDTLTKVHDVWRENCGFSITSQFGRVSL